MLTLGKRLSTKSKLMLMLIGVSLGSVLVVGLLSWERSRANLREVIGDRLTTVRVIKANQLETYFQGLRAQVETLSEDRMVVTAMAEFNRGFDALNNQSVPEAWNNEIAEYYNKEFFPRLSNSVPGKLEFENYAPKSPASRYLQYYYLAKNPNPVGKKNELLDAKDGSEYSKTHAKYHDIFHHLIDKFGYYNLFLIDPETGEVVYTVSKDNSFTTNLIEGPYRNSNLAQLVAAVHKNPERGTIQVVDFQPYAPSYGKPAAFIGGPIYNGPHMIGILAFQLPVDRINQIMVGDPTLQKRSKTTETYVVGSDLLMRSDSRFLSDDPEKYKKAIVASGTPESNISAIKQWNSSILLQKVNTEAARQGINGKEGTAVVQGYLDQEVLSSYAPLHIPGLNWAILNEKGLDEAYQPVAALQVYILIVTVLLIVLVTWGSSAAISNFLKPVHRLSEGMRRLSEGDLAVEVKRDSDDEFGEMTDAFNSTVGKVRQQQELIAQKERQNNALLLNIMPAPVAERVKQGEQQVVDSVKLASVLSARINGVTEMSLYRDAKEIAPLLSNLISAFDEATTRHEIGKIKTLGDQYIAACGVATPRLDDTRLMMNFALEMFSILQRFNNEYKTEFSLLIGIDEGAVMAGIVGTKQFSYDVWGETLSVANFLQLNTQPNTIRVTQKVYERLHDLYNFERGEDLLLPELNKTLVTWVFKRSIVSLSDGSRSQTEETSESGRIQAEV